MIASLPELRDFVEYEPEGEDVEQSFDNVDVTTRVDRVYGTRVETQVYQREHHLSRILIHWSSHAVWVEVRKEGDVILALVVDKAGRVIFVLNKPASPKVVDTFLVTGGGNDAERMHIHGLFYDIRWRRCTTTNHD